MEKDDFDRLLSSRLTEDEWQGFATILEISKFPTDLDKRRILINKAFRHFYGNTIPNRFRNEFEPDYEKPILDDALKEINTSDEKLTDLNKASENMSHIEIILHKEDIVFRKVEAYFKEKKKREFSKDTDNFVKDLIECVDSYYGVLRKVKKAGTKLVIGGGVAAGLAKKVIRPVAGGAYMVGVAINEMFFETNWKKVLPVIMFTYVIRKRMYIEDSLKQKETD